MTLTLGSIMDTAEIDPQDAQVIRHVYIKEHEDSGNSGIHPESTDTEILEYTREQSANPRIFPAVPPRTWVVFLREGGDRARLWAVVENHGEMSNDGTRRTFDLVVSERMTDLRNRLVIGWRSLRTWRLNASTAADYPVAEIADARPVPFPGWIRSSYRFRSAVEGFSQQPVLRPRCRRHSLTSIPAVTAIATAIPAPMIQGLPRSPPTPASAPPAAMSGRPQQSSNGSAQHASRSSPVPAATMGPARRSSRS